MTKYYHKFKALMVACTVSGFYFPGIEKIIRNRWLLLFLNVQPIIPMLGLPTYLTFALKHFFTEPNFVTKMFASVQCVYLAYSVFILCSFYYIRNDVVKAFEMWDDLFHEDMFTEDREELLRKNVRFANQWMKIFGSFTVFCGALYCSLTFFNEDKSLGHPSGIPYKRQSPDFEIVATYELLMMVYSEALIITYDSINSFLLALEESQFLHLKRSLGRTVAILSATASGNVVISTGEGSIDDLESISPQKVEQTVMEVDNKVRVWVKQHQDLLRFHTELQKIFETPLMVKYMVFVLLIVLAFFLIVVDNGFTAKDSFVAITFIVNSYALFYVNTKFGDSIKDTAEGLFSDAFGESWNLYPRKMKSKFKIIAMRCNRPVHYLAARLYPLSSRSFLKIFTSAYSFFTFLLHVMRRKT